MSSQVYTAAKAFFPFHGKSKEESWKELTAMFAPNGQTEKSYIIGSYPLECVKRQKPDDISLGDTFKFHKFATGGANYIQIVESTPYESFAYDEQYMPISGEDIDTAYEYTHRTRMEFFLQSHPEATLVEIRRRSKAGPFTRFEKLISGTWFEKLIRGVNSNDSAAELLKIIVKQKAINGLHYWGSEWEKGKTTDGEITVKRDDSYRIDF